MTTSPDRLALGQRLLGDRGRLLVAEVAVQRRDDRRRRLGDLERVRARRRSMPAMHRSASSAGRCASSRIDSSTLRAMTGSIDVELEVAGGTAPRDGARRCRRPARTTCSTASRDHRVDLARHDRRARLQVGQVQLAEPGARAGAHPAEVVADLGQADRDRAQRAGQLDQPVARALRLEVVARLGQRQAGELGADRAMTAAAKPGGVLIPVPTAVPPSGSSRDPRQRGVDPLDAVPHLRGVAARTPGPA